MSQMTKLYQLIEAQEIEARAFCILKLPSNATLLDLDRSRHELSYARSKMNSFFKEALVEITSLQFKGGMTTDDLEALKERLNKLHNTWTQSIDEVADSITKSTRLLRS